MKSQTTNAPPGATAQLKKDFHYSGDFSDNFGGSGFRQQPTTDTISLN